MATAISSSSIDDDQEEQCTTTTIAQTSPPPPPSANVEWKTPYNQMNSTASSLRVSTGSAQSSETITIQSPTTPVRYVDERTKALGRKAELEALRQRNQLVQTKKAFNHAVSPSATSTLASFFQQQKQRRHEAKQLRMGTLSSLNKHTFVGKGLGANSKKMATRPQTPPPHERSAFSRMASVDVFVSPEWKERKKEALKRLSAYRQLELDAMARLVAEEEEMEQGHVSPIKASSAEPNTDNSQLEDQEVPRVDPLHLDSLLMLHSELKGFFTTTDDENDGEEEQEDDSPLQLNEEEKPFSQRSWPFDEEQNKVDDHHDEPSPEFQDEKKEELEMALFKPESEEDDCPSLLDSATDMIAQCEALLGVSCGTSPKQIKNDDQESTETPTADSTSAATNSTTRDMISQCEALLAAAAKSCTSPDKQDIVNDDDGEASLELGNLDESKVEANKKDLAVQTSEHGTTSASNNLPPPVASPSGYDKVASSSIEDHMKHIMAMQASLSFTKTSSGSPCLSRADTASTNAHDNTTKQQQLLDPMCGPRQSFVSQQQAAGDLPPKPSTEPPQEDVGNEQQEAGSGDFLPPQVMLGLPPNDDNNQNNETVSVISSIGSSIEQTLRNVGGGSRPLSRQSSSSSLSSFWQMDGEDSPARDQPRRNHPRRSRSKPRTKDSGNKKLQLFCTNSEQYLPNLHASKGPCERCFDMMSEQDKAKFRANGRHILMMLVRGGCHRSCTAYPRTPDQPPVRLCRKCYFDCHRGPKSKKNKS